MRFLANENFPGQAVEALRAAGHDVAWIHADAPGSPDELVLARAAREAAVLLTFDKDFGELACALSCPALAVSSCSAFLCRRLTASAKPCAPSSRRETIGRDDFL